MKSVLSQIIFLLTFQGYQVKGYNILAHWSLNGTEQGLTLRGGPTFIEGRYPGSKAINFNQPSSCFARIPKVELRGKSLTIAMWFKVKILERWQYFFSDWYSPWQFAFGIYSDGIFFFERHSSAQPWFKVTSTKIIEAGKWTHVAVTWNQDAGIVTLFINGIENSYKAFSTETIWNSPTKDAYQIGDDGHDHNHQFLGSVMDLYIIEAVLSSQQLISIKGFPQITSSINNTVVYTNETVRCQAEGSPAPFVAWIRSGAVLVNKTSSAEIIITELDGEYMCVASNQEGIEKLIVKTKDSIEYTKSSINNTVVYTNETVQCQADDSPTPYVAWERSGVVLVNKTSTAEITITESDGEYICVASKRQGIDKLFVKAKAPLQLCHDHLLITDVSRAVNHIFQSSEVREDSTDIDLSKWYRIQSPAGNQLPTTCVPQSKCGTQAPGWLNGIHPNVQDGIVKRTVCFHFNGDCCYLNTTVHIRKCQGFYVYKFGAVPKQLPAPRHCIENKHINTQEIPYFTFTTNKNSREDLVGHVMYSEAEVQKDLICLNYCIIFVDCKSFNYSKGKKICELNNATRQEYPQDIIMNDTFAYYEKILFDLFKPK